MLMAGNNSHSDTSSLLHQLENELKRDMSFSSTSGATYSRGESYNHKDQRSGDSSSFSLSTILSAPTYTQSPPLSSSTSPSVLGTHTQRLPPLHQAIGTNPINTPPPTTYSSPEDNRRGNSDIVGGMAYKSLPPQAYQTPSSPSPRKRTPTVLGRSASTGSGRVENRGRITKVHRTERLNIEERSWFDAEGDLAKASEVPGPTPRVMMPVTEVKRKEVPYRIQSDPNTHQENTSTFGVEDQVADILSTFNTNTPSPSSHPSDLQNPLDDIHLSSLLDRTAAPSLPATIYSLAVSNPTFFQILRGAVPPEYCAISFFKRIESQVYAICRRHSDYLFSGPSLFDFTGKGNCSSSVYGKALAEDEEMCLPDAKWCEAALRRRVNTIRKHLEMRKPLGNSAREQAMRVLVRILWEVADKGGYEETGIMGDGRAEKTTSQHGNRRSPQDQSTNIGLYSRLIGKAGVSVADKRRSGGFQGAVPMPFGCWPLPSSAGQTENDDGFFVIEALWGLADCADVCLDQLVKVSNRIRAYGARDGYIEELDRFLMEAKRRREHKMAFSEDAGLGEEEAILSRRSSVDSTKRARRPSREELAGIQERVAFRRRVS